MSSTQQVEKGRGWDIAQSRHSRYRRNEDVLRDSLSVWLEHRVCVRKWLEGGCVVGAAAEPEGPCVLLGWESELGQEVMGIPGGKSIEVTSWYLG